MSQDIPPKIIYMTEPQLERLIRRTVERTLDARVQQRIADAEILTPKKVARLLRVADKTVYEALASGVLKGHQDDHGRWRVPIDRAREWGERLL